MEDQTICWGNLHYHTSRIHGNETRIGNNVKVKIIDRNGAVITESEKVMFKQELDHKGKRYIDTWLEVYIK